MSVINTTENNSKLFTVKKRSFFLFQPAGSEVLGTFFEEKLMQ